MAEFGAPSIGMSNSRTISIEETTKRKFSFSVEDLARSDAKAPESPRQTLNDSLAARAIEGDRFVAQAASESCTPSSSSTADKRNQSKDLHPAEASPSQPIKKARSLFSVEQVYALEQCFRRQKYLGSKERLELALALNMSETQVKTWFQNRRMKMKRKRAESVERYAKMSFLNNVAHGMFPQQQGYHGYQPPLPPPPPSSCLAPPRVLCNDLYQLDYPCTPAPWSFPPNPSQPTPPAYWGYHPDQFSGLR